MTLLDKVRHRCCDAFELTKQSGTDNEAYGPLLWVLDGTLRFGCDTPSLNFCPWCGHPIQEPTHD